MSLAARAVLRVACWAVAVLTFGVYGHRWRIYHMNASKHVALAHLHPLAGCDAMCERCEALWLDGG